MKRYVLHIMVFILFASTAGSQTRYIVWYTPSSAETINGIGIGPMNSGSGSIRPHRQTVNGLQFELPGTGFLRFPLETPQRSYLQNAGIDRGGVEVNGVLAALMGSAGVNTVNGLFISPFFGFADEVNGISCNSINFIGSSEGLTLGIVNSVRDGNGTSIGLYNTSEDFDGIQIGLFNVRERGDGLQIGLINIKGGSFLPFLNF